MASRSPSPALLEANRRLHQLRACLPAGSAALAGPPLPARPGAQAAARPLLADRALVASLPAHLGWGSQAATAALRRPAAVVAATSMVGADPRVCPLSPAEAPPSPRSAFRLPPSAFVKLYPDIALGMLRRRRAAAGRIWLLARHLDASGRGCLSLDQLRRQLAGRQGRLRVCGRRQLRHLLRQGDGIFWRRDKRHLWLFAPARVAAALGVVRLDGRPVALHLSTLLASIGRLRAHLYASFHSGRRPDPSRQPDARRRPAAPISRQALSALSGVSRRSQHAYERRSRTRIQKNFAVGRTASPDRLQNGAWRKGNALFQFVDRQGRQGQPGQPYLAWQLPNSFSGPHRQLPRGRQKRINHQLADLFMKGMTGNGRQGIGRRFFANGRLAARAASRTASQECYWPALRGRSPRLEAGRRYRLWQVVAAGPEGV